jgi:hypothetical protein
MPRFCLCLVLATDCDRQDWRRDNAACFLVFRQSIASILTAASAAVDECQCMTPASALIYGSVQMLLVVVLA